MAKTPKSQIEKFKQIAHDLETIEDEARFNEALKRVAKAPPPDKLKSDPKKPGR
jgi:hypothetical protein